jgi:GMP synthase (glutamine-hydrolysing)
MTAVCAIQHAPCETLGLLAEVLIQQGITVNYVRPFRRERIPRGLGNQAGLIVMGGPMGVYEQERYPYLRQELRLIEHALKEGKAVLGVCLGSQLLAAALGAKVSPGQRKEIGWHPITLARAAAKDRLWRGVEKSFLGYHWHGDVFKLPRGAVALASSELTACQAFSYGTAAYGILFHLEVNRPIIRDMTRAFKPELREAGLTAREIIGGIPRHLECLHRAGRSVFKAWAGLASEIGDRPVQAPLARSAPAGAGASISSWPPAAAAA